MSFKSLVWKERLYQWKLARENLSGRSGRTNGLPDASEFGSPEEVELHLLEMDNELRQPLSRKVLISSSMINPYRFIILFRLVILAFFLWHRLTHPIQNAHGLWLASVLCEVWFAISWILDQLPKWQPVNRETYPDCLCLRYNQPGNPCEPTCIDVFAHIVDPVKEPPLVTANTILPILSVDYPPEKVSCYVSDNGAALLTLETLLETGEFARKWVPFSKKFNIEPRSPECYFSQKFEYLKDNTFPMFSKERRLMKINLKGLDGIQGPLNVGTRCLFNRKALYGYDALLEPTACKTSWWGPKKKNSGVRHGYYTSTHIPDDTRFSLLIVEPCNLETEFPSIFLSMEKCFGQSYFIASNLVNDDRFSQSASPDEILREAINVISCNYEDNTEWGREIGWIYGSQNGDILTGFKMHARGWRSIYCMPACAAFRDLHQSIFLIV